MDKMKMAHEYAMQLVASPDYVDDMSLLEFVDHVWKYADAMQAEADKRNNTERPKVLFDLKPVDEWQPDWSQAPERAKWWAMDEDGECYWFGSEPTLKRVYWLSINGSNPDLAPSFGYTGNWKDSLRERPE